MPGFNSGTAVEAMTYDFTAHGGPKGTIPEPSQEQIEVFFKHIEDTAKFVREIENQAKKVDDDDDEAVEDFIENIPRDKVKQYQNEMSVWISDVCSGAPTVEEVRALPYRVFGAFTAWLAGEIGPKDNDATKG
jgi:hypothetical protein